MGGFSLIWRKTDVLLILIAKGRDLIPKILDKIFINVSQNVCHWTEILPKALNYKFLQFNFFYLASFI